MERTCDKNDKHKGVTKLDILIVEDDHEKFDRICKVIKSCQDKNKNNLENIIRATTVADSRQHLSEKHFDLMILDVRMPIREMECPDDTAGIQLLEQLFLDDEYKRPRYVVGLSGIEGLYSNASKKFHRHGWILLQYSPTDQSWGDALCYFVKHINTVAFSGAKHLQADVVILAALEDPEFTSVREVFPELKGPRTLDGKTLYWEGDVVTEKGTIRVVAGYSWQMGLTAAAVLTGKFINEFSPKLIAMTGICAGFEDSINLGDVIVATQSWEWQGGKIKDGPEGPTLFAAPEPYRASQSIITNLRSLSSDKSFSSKITRDVYPQDVGETWAVHYGPIVSGLSVVASSTVMAEAQQQHRKMLGLEMEAYAIYAAADLNAHECKRVVLKGVCDFGSSEKADNFQKKAAMRSAICLRALVTKKDID